HLQRRLARKKKGSHNWCKTKLQLAKQYEHLSNQRRDYLHKVSRYYVRTYDTIVVEDLDIKNMLKKRKRTKSYRTLRRHILDASWGIFFHYLDYKAANAGRTFKKVKPHGTSQICARCGHVVPKQLNVRVHLCSFCSLKLDRDYNASLNILKRGMERPSLLVETNILTLIDTSTVVSGRLLSLKQETPFL
ncbi:MAG: RNA-guided endonuclease InsQ/TnpB family protein, partial [Candidatus Heimdallarchaeaceae archaeon]